MIERLLSLVPLAVLLWCASRPLPLGMGSTLDRLRLPCWELAAWLMSCSDLIAPLLWAAAIALPVLAWTQGMPEVVK